MSQTHKHYSVTKTVRYQPVRVFSYKLYIELAVNLVKFIFALMTCYSVRHQETVADIWWSTYAAIHFEFKQIHVLYLYLKYVRYMAQQSRLEFNPLLV